MNYSSIIDSTINRFEHAKCMICLRFRSDGAIKSLSLTCLHICMCITSAIHYVFTLLSDAIGHVYMYMSIHTCLSGLNTTSLCLSLGWMVLAYQPMLAKPMPRNMPVKHTSSVLYMSDVWSYIREQLRVYPYISWHACAMSYTCSNMHICLRLCACTRV